MDNFFTKAKKEIDSFDQGIQVIAPRTNSTSVRYLSDDSQGYHHQVTDVLDSVDMATLSQFKTGKTDSDGTRKTYLNVVNFIQQVADKQVDLDVKDYLFTPRTSEAVDKAWVYSESFHKWAQANFFGKTKNDLINDYTRYGHAVSKKVGKEIERVPLRTIICTQDAETIEEMIFVNGHFTLVHDKMTKDQMEQFPDWNTEDLDYKEEYTVYERYGKVSKEFLNKTNGFSVEEGDEEIFVPAVVVFSIKEVKDSEQTDGYVFFAEQIKESPFDEVAWNKIDGRWLGIGPVEDQLENQIARNLTANARRKSLLWASKKIFQTQGTNQNGNLVKHVKNGDVLEVGPNGLISQVPMESRSLAEFQQDSQEWQENTRQKSFTFEVATGESLPSGTPFRLGVVLSNSANLFFGKKQEKLDIFFRQIFWTKLVDIFKAESKKGKLAIAAHQAGAERLRNAAEIENTNRRIISKLIDKDITRNLLSLNIDFEAEREVVRQELKKSPYFFADNLESIFETHDDIDLILAGENVNIEKNLASLTTLYQTMAQAGDPRAASLLDYILAQTGINLNAILPAVQPQQPQQQQAQPGQQQVGGLQGLVEQANVR